MPPRRTAPLRGKARVGAQHADWLTLIEPAGQFLTLPVLRRVFPDGLPQLDSETRRETRERAARMDWDSTAEVTGWIEYLLGEVCRWGPRLRTGPRIGEQVGFRVPEHGAMLRPEYLLANADGSPRALVDRYPAGTPLDRRLAGDRWAASPIDRLGVLCRALGVTVGVATNGREFAVVYAPAGSVGGHATFDTALFAEGAEANLLTAFAAILGAQRFFAAAAGETLEALLTESASSQADVTNMLGLQVRRAVELLVASISRANLDADGKLLAGVAPQRVYEASATVVMRLVFLLYAEERNLLPLGEQLYDDNYAATTLYDRLAEASDRFGDEPLELRSAAWQRLLATFRAVSAGIDHDRLRMPPYGGGLFDPDRFPFLEGRTDDQPWQASPAHPLPVDDLTVREILRALQFLTSTQAGATESRRLSFRTLDVEQIGHIYEGTLDHSALMARHNVVGLIGRQGVEPEVVLRDLEQAAEQDRLLDFLTEQTGRPAKALQKLLDTPLDAETERRLRTATHNDADLTRRIAPYAHLLREDLRGLPIVFVPGSVYVTETTARRDTGTEYTPRELAEEIVTGALQPLVYSPGPAQGADRADWVLRPSAELLALRVCDPAVGSGAILVAACRYLADRLLEAWQAEGAVPAGYRPDPTVVADEDELLVMARRAVADRCLYGVDRDPMAVEMAKLSLWLTTMSRERPFTFVDHAIVAGDSLLGVTSLEQITAFHMDPARGRRLHEDLFGDLAAEIGPLVDRATDLRRQIAELPVVAVRDVQRKERLLAQARAALAEAQVLGDLVVGGALAGPAMETKLVSVQGRVVRALRMTGVERVEAFADLASTARAWLDLGRPDAAPLRLPLHWPLAFADVARFDAMVGNPPFLGGQRLTARIGMDMREFLVRWLADGRRGSADLVSYFFLRAAQVARGFGFIATNTIAQGDTREVCLDALLADGWTIHAANKSRPWPGAASLEVAQVWLTDRPWPGPVVADGTAVPGVTATLDPVGKVSGNPQRLAANAGIAFQGCIVLGLGFTLTEAEAREMIDANPRNAEVIFPYLNGQDLNSSPTQSASRWVINFFDWPEEKARMYALPFAKVERDVKPERMRNNRKVYRDSWWKYAEKRPAMLAAIAGLERVIVITRVSDVVMPLRVPAHQVFADRLFVFASANAGLLAVLSSSIHGEWARSWSGTLETRTNYSAADALETFPFPPSLAPLEAPGLAMEMARHTVMHGRGIGLTPTYNLVNTPTITDDDVVALRDAHVALDAAVLAAYGWQDLDPAHGFHDTAQGRRFTIGPAARVELLDRLLELNHARYAEEVASGLHSKAAGRKRGKAAGASDQLELL